MSTPAQPTAGFCYIMFAIGDADRPQQRVFVLHAEVPKSRSKPFERLEWRKVIASQKDTGLNAVYWF